ncbi:hypothetical protein HDC37_001096 [Microbacterium sp. AK009]|uniref:hypothetical protein n=1 Tax=Microbacterium sp. AK009 TaxID=2723068 RepID=UPI0015CE7536|nr:hypothetical protein [Microbacterium sp. AK009]NYF16282.1 hypothetical protein [Microbacterium sp. AK009]
MNQDAVLAWVESPLQLIGAAEWAATHRRTVPVAGRLTPQMSETADLLLARGARFGEMEPYLGVPWKLLSQHPHWLVGDGFSGQFRLAAAVLRPRTLTFLDDGAIALPFADTLLQRRPYARPHVTERGLTSLAAPFAAESIARRARTGAAHLFTAFDLGEDRLAALADRGFGIAQHTFAWTRATAPASADLGTRVILGSARPIDGRMPRETYLAWLTALAASAPADTGPTTYLPHRRETAEQLEAVRRIPELTVTATSVPVELILAGATRPVHLHTLPSTTSTTLRLVLAGSGSTINGEPVPAASRQAGFQT